MKHGAFVSAVVLCCSGSAYASFAVGNPMLLSGSFVVQTPAGQQTYSWGATQGQMATFGSLSSLPIFGPSGSSVGFVMATSMVTPPDQLPLGKKFGAMIGLEPVGEIRNILTAAGVAAVGNVELLNIKERGGVNRVNTARADGPTGPVPANQIMIVDGVDIYVRDVPGAEFLVFPFVKLSWTQIPAPGTAALMGVATVVGLRRRR